MLRQIALDTETTGIDPKQGHRMIEVACVEIVNRRITDKIFHSYLNPDRAIGEESLAIHGISREFLQDKPRFAEIVDEFLTFIQGAELIIHNAEFDVGFINHELSLLKQSRPPLVHYCQILDTLALARTRHPGQKNSLDALCKRYYIDNSQRKLHGALLDAQLLAEVYLAMTGGQVSLLSAAGSTKSVGGVATIRRIATPRQPLTVLPPTAEELTVHAQSLATIDKVSGGHCLWLTERFNE